jgi:hypothetical protein
LPWFRKCCASPSQYGSASCHLPWLILPSFDLTDEDMHFWYPSLEEVMEAFHSLGAHNPALYPLGPFHHGGRLVPSLPHCCLLSFVQKLMGSALTYKVEITEQATGLLVSTSPRRASGSQAHTEPRWRSSAASPNACFCHLPSKTLLPLLLCGSQFSQLS